MRTLLFALIALFGASTARAETPVVVATNAPIMWPYSIGASVYVPLSEHHVLRANVASYTPMLEGWAALSGDGDDYYEHYARTNDVGIGLVHYSDKRYEGYMVEVGALVRFRRESTVEYGTDVGEEGERRFVGGRALLGWSWLFYRRVFAAVAVGGSVGYEWGHDTKTPDRMETTKISTLGESFEGYLRFGVLLDL